MQIGDEPANFCGICGDEVTNPIGYSIGTWEWQRLATHHQTAFPDADVQITMCEDCYRDYSALKVSEFDTMDYEEREQHRKAADQILAQVPLESMFWEFSHHYHRSE